MSDQGSEYAQFIKDELAAEEARRENINTRAFTSMAASGTQFGVATGLVLLLRGQHWLPTRWIVWVYIAALGLYLMSVVLGLFASRSHKTAVTSPATMMAMVHDHWVDPEVDARNAVAVARVYAIAALREGTNTKATWLRRSVLAQILAVVALVAAVIVTAA